MEFASAYFYLPLVANQQPGAGHHDNTQPVPPIPLQKPNPAPKVSAPEVTYEVPDDDVIGDPAPPSNDLPKPSTLTPRPCEPTGQQRSPRPTKRALLPPPIALRPRSPSLLKQPIRDHAAPPGSSPSDSTSEQCSEAQEVMYDVPEGGGERGSDVGPEYMNPEGYAATPQPPELTNSERSKPPNRAAPPLPPRPSFMKKSYIEILPSTVPLESSPPNPRWPEPLPQHSCLQESGNTNIVLVNFGKLVDISNSMQISENPTFCPACGSVTIKLQNQDSVCVFCSDSKRAKNEPICSRDSLFRLPSDPGTLPHPVDPCIILCIDVSGSMSVTTEVEDDGKTVHISRLQAVKDAVTEFLETLDSKSPLTRVGLVTFNRQVTVYTAGLSSPVVLTGYELVDSDFLLSTGKTLPLPESVGQNKGKLQSVLHSLRESGSTALGPAALVSIAMASRKPGSKVIVCTDGKANADLGNLEEVESEDELGAARRFYSDLSESALRSGVIVSVVTLEGTECSLSELGRLADSTGGTVNIVHPSQLYGEFQNILEDKVTASNVQASFLVPTDVYFKHESHAGRKLTQHSETFHDTEKTFELGVKESGLQTLQSMTSLPVQLQVKFTLPTGETMFRVVTEEKPTTTDWSLVLSSLSIQVLQIHSSQLSARLVMEGRLEESRREALNQKELIESVLGKQRDSVQDDIYEDWIDAMTPIYDSIYQGSEEKPGDLKESKMKSFSDEFASLLFRLKNVHKRALRKKRGGEAKHQPITT
ncbi:circularly permutated Ras protein 1-like [Polyodon spathula]|uniref:circularly permutated Ras protein 1-like n=1 Tax=Polyodon spathula TaxID=7913 RepID=UPI001B7EE304|nr:circularly permutated Ras protein 1-like [Polyodon spathula]XP_041093524.1 circularly permutated Ras protein 1-like [Polyodon spathula]XP_041093525.1 circularly permutated Ras protein 1-like [Polyodon spathula]XP_041093526.1 circularly permutated Ras protein 1-like [Polyodon spathula]XP_041093527.1 circularly permutated Ras protein 1-like [Polyodon spathula]